MSDKIKVGVIGLGNMGRHHARNYAQIEEAELIAVCDNNPDKASHYSNEYHCKGFSDIDEFLDSGVQAVNIAVSTNAHYDIAKKTLSKGIHTLIEKPIASTVEEAQELIQLAKDKNVILTVGHIERFNPAILKLKELIDENSLGEIISINTKRASGFPPQIRDANVIIDLAVHDIDICNDLIGKLPQSIQGTKTKAIHNKRDDISTILLDYGNATSIIQVNWITPLKIRTLEAHGTQGYVKLDFIGQTLEVYKSDYTKTPDEQGDDIITFQESKPEIISCKGSQPLENELKHFLSCIKTNSQPMVSPDQAIDALRIALSLLNN